ncbi:MAG: hypothetical protein KDB80_13000, partial [Planctomycetes bacterium]|nr:hypothetical protein [Planctomycetota bacterium]
MATTGLVAGQELTIPLVAGGVDAAASSDFPAAFDTHSRGLFVYANWNFAAIDEVIRITRIRFRAEANETTAGGTIASCRIDLSSKIDGLASIDSTYDLDHGADRQTCFTGPVSVLPTGGNSPNDDSMVVTLTTPFYFDPRTGADLVIDLLRVADYLGDPGGRLVDAVDGGTAGRQVRGPLLVAQGTIQDLVPVVTLEFDEDVAMVRTVGTGCGQGRGSTFHELFHHRWNPYDLADGFGWTAYRTGPSYVVLPGTGALVLPTGIALVIGDDEVVEVTLPWTMSHPRGMTQSLWVSSNGFVAFESTTDADPTESYGELLAGPPRVCPLWTSLDPACGGAVYAESDANDPSIFHITWLGVPEYVNAATTGGSNTFQISFHASGSFD